MIIKSSVRQDYKKPNGVFIMKTKQRIIKILGLLIIVSTVLSICAVIFLVSFSRKNVNANYDEKLFDLAKAESYTEYYSNGRELGAKENKYDPQPLCSLSLGGLKKRWVPIEAISDNVKEAFISAEDREFYKHSGVNYRRTAMALLNSIFHFKPTFGASTITQQVVKNISGDNDISFKRKLTEIIRAINIEKNHSKQEIFELYLNIVPMGENIYGINMASQLYFGKEPFDLGITEAATLAAITNAPTRYNPHLNPDLCLEKRNNVLYAMLESGSISKDEYESMVREPLSVLPLSEGEESVSSWFIETVNTDVIADLRAKYGLSESAAAAMLYNGGMKIYTTENELIQSYLENYFEDVSNFPKEVSSGLEYAMTVIDPVNGDLLGIVGSVGAKSGNRLLNFATAPHTPGSALKPIALYGPLIDSGKITPSTVFDDVPQEFIMSTSGMIPYPQNYPRVYDGLTTVKDALRKSKNTVAYKLYGMLGAEKIYKMLKSDFGFDTIVRSGRSSSGSIVTDLAPSPLALGQLSYGVSLKKLTEAYTVFPSEGVLHKCRSYVKVVDKDGEVILDNQAAEKRIFSKEGARVMNQLLMNVTENGTASSVTLKNVIDTAGKTGTSGDDRDRLFIGFTPYAVAGIWCGYRDSGKPIGYVAPTHLKIWDDVMRRIHKDILLSKSEEPIRSFSTKGLIRHEFCCDSGMLYSENCMLDPRGNRLDHGYFMKGTVPKDLCDKHVLFMYDKDAEGIATECCPEDSLKLISLIKVCDRSFPMQITVTDAEYVCREVDGTRAFPRDFDRPYFFYYIPEGEYVGIGRQKKQYNSFCFIHDE